jgi:hypothetical protein
MAQPDNGSGGKQPHSPEEKNRAVLSLILRVVAVDAVIIAAYFYVVLGLGWDPVTTLVPLLGVSMATGLYFAWRRHRIEKGS